MTYSPYESCTKCAGKAQPGAVDLLKYVMNKFDYTDSLGIYNCRYIAGTNILSNHSCGCAVDIFIPHNGWGNPRPELGNPVVQFLDEISSTIGLTEQIYNRVRYDASAPRGKAYGGAHPHHDHIHLSISKSKGQSLTYNEIVEVHGPPEGGTMATYRSVINVPENSDGSPKDWAKGVIDSGIEQGLINVSDDNTDDWERPLTAGEYWAFESRIRPDGGGGSVDLSNYYTKAQSDNRYPRKGGKRTITL